MQGVFFSKTNGIWIASLQEKRIIEKPKVSDENRVFKDVYYWEIMESVEADSFGELMKRIGEKNWVDLINKNTDD